MPTYYEMLKIQSTASAAEIEAAIQGQYDQWRRLVTHHDVKVANQANLALSTLETIRATLSDPSKRSAYDAGIGLGDTVGGLADVSVILQGLGPTMTPPAPGSSKTTGMPSAAPSSSLWTCPKPECGADNPPHTRYCFKCGTELVRQCPECDAMTSLIATKMCGTCGYNYEVALERRTLKERVSVAQNEVRGLEARIAAAKARKVEGCGRNLLGLVGIFCISWGMLGFRDSFWGWLIGIVCLGTLVLWYARVESEKGRELRNVSLLLEAKSHELSASEQEYQRLALHKTGE